jgi:hypothetical protein
VDGITWQPKRELGSNGIAALIMSQLEQKEVCKVTTVEDDTDFQSYLETNPSGLVMLAGPWRDWPEPVLQQDTGDFVKWLKINAPSIPVEVRKKEQRLLLQSGDYLLHLAFLDSDVSVQIYLNMVASYLYDKLKCALKGEKARVHFSAVYEDKANKVVKRFDFEGDIEALQKVIKRFDLNKFLDD